jgi:hypothetical protein
MRQNRPICDSCADGRHFEECTKAHGKRPCTICEQLTENGCAWDDMVETVLRAKLRSAQASEARYALLVAACASTGTPCFCGCHVTFLDDLTAEEAEAKKRGLIVSLALIVPAYNELLYQVGNVYPGETRHQTALRYLRAAESSSGQCGAAATEAPK